MAFSVGRPRLMRRFNKYTSDFLPVIFERNRLRYMTMRIFNSIRCEAETNVHGFTR